MQRILLKGESPENSWRSRSRCVFGGLFLLGTCRLDDTLNASACVCEYVRIADCSTTGGEEGMPYGHSFANMFFSCFLKKMFARLSLRSGTIPVTRQVDLPPSF